MRQLRSYDTSRYKKSRNKNRVGPVKNLARHPTVILHTGLWNRMRATTRMRKFALNRQRPAIHKSRYSQLPLTKYA